MCTGLEILPAAATAATTAAETAAAADAAAAMAAAAAPTAAQTAVGGLAALPEIATPAITEGLLSGPALGGGTASLFGPTEAAAAFGSQAMGIPEVATAAGGANPSLLSFLQGGNPTGWLNNTLGADNVAKIDKGLTTLGKLNTAKGLLMPETTGAAKSVSGPRPPPVLGPAADPYASPAMTSLMSLDPVQRKKLLEQLMRGGM